MQDMVEALSKIHSAHRKLMVAQRASLWVCLRKLTGGGGQLATCEQAILASHSATKRHDEVGFHILFEPERAVSQNTEPTTSSPSWGRVVLPAVQEVLPLFVCLLVCLWEMRMDGEGASGVHCSWGEVTCQQQGARAFPWILPPAPLKCCKRLHATGLTHASV